MEWYIDLLGLLSNHHHHHDHGGGRWLLHEELAHGGARVREAAANHRLHVHEGQKIQKYKYQHKYEGQACRKSNK